MNIMPAGSGTIPKKSRNVSTRGRLDSGAPNPVDVHVGGRMRLRRTLLGITQEWREARERRRAGQQTEAPPPPAPEVAATGQDTMDMFGDPS